jgi:hypothetical protein
MRATAPPAPLRRPAPRSPLRPSGSTPAAGRAALSDDVAARPSATKSATSPRSHAGSVSARSEKLSTLLALRESLLQAVGGAAQRPPEPPRNPAGECSGIRATPQLRPARVAFQRRGGGRAGLNSPPPPSPRLKPTRRHSQTLLPAAGSGIAVARTGMCTCVRNVDPPPFPPTPLPPLSTAVDVVASSPVSPIAAGTTAAFTRAVLRTLEGGGGGSPVAGGRTPPHHAQRAHAGGSWDAPVAGGCYSGSGGTAGRSAALHDEATFGAVHLSPAPPPRMDASDERGLLAFASPTAGAVFSPLDRAPPLPEPVGPLAGGGWAEAWLAEGSLTGATLRSGASSGGGIAPDVTSAVVGRNATLAQAIADLRAMAKSIAAASAAAASHPTRLPSVSAYLSGVGRESVLPMPAATSAAYAAAAAPLLGPGSPDDRHKQPSTAAVDTRAADPASQAAGSMASTSAESSPRSVPASSARSPTSARSPASSARSTMEALYWASLGEPNGSDGALATNAPDARCSGAESLVAAAAAAFPGVALVDAAP